MDMRLLLRSRCVEAIRYLTKRINRTVAYSDGHACTNALHRALRLGPFSS